MNRVTLELDLNIPDHLLALTSDGLLLAAASNVVGAALKGHLLTVLNNLSRDDLSEESMAILARSNLSHNGWADVLSACVNESIRIKHRE